jgi:hypothetical protein
MGLADLFRPKHKHSDPEVRVEAVRRLGAEEVETLARLAREDDHVKVRKAAIERLEDPVKLVEVAAREPDSGLRKLASTRARVRLTAWAEGESEERALAAIRRIAELDEGERALIDVARRAPLPGVRRAAVDSLQGDRALADVARSGADAELRVRALERIVDVEVLRAVAVDESRKEIGYAVVDRLEDPDSLAYVASKGKNRSVRARASRKLASQSRAEGSTPEEKRAHAERVQLCRRAESLARTDRWRGAADEAAELRRAWDALDDSAPEAEVELGERFARALRRFDDRYEREGKAAAAAAERSALTGAAAAAEPAPPKASAEPADLRAAADTGDAPASAASEPAAAPEPTVDPAREQAARAQREAKAKAAVEALREIVDDLERRGGGEESSPSIKALDRALQRAQTRYRSVKGLPNDDAASALVERFEELRRQMIIRLRELHEAEDWKRWANVAKKEELIVRAEALLAAEGAELPQLKELQAAWKQAGPVPREKNDVLWARFKEICDQIYERVKAVRAAQIEVEKQNLELKEALARRAEELAESAEWEKTAEEIKRLQREWKEIGPVPRRRSGALWKRFRGACDRFFERRKPHLEKRLAELGNNLEAKQKVIAELEALSESAQDWAAVEADVRRLRSEFREIGSVPRAEMDAVGERFRAACDKVAERRREARAAQAEALRGKLEAAAAHLEARLGGEEGAEGDAASDVMALRAALRELERTGAETVAEARPRVDALTLRAMEARPDAFRGTELDPQAIAKKMRKLCERAEELVPEQPEAPAADASPEEMAAALKAALAERALGVHRGEPPAGDAVAELREYWGRLGPIPGEEARELEARFMAACERAAAHAGPSADEGQPDPT